MKDSDKKMGAILVLIAVAVWGGYQVVVSQIDVSYPRSDASDGIKKVLKVSCSEDDGVIGADLSWSRDQEGPYNILQRSTNGVDGWESIYRENALYSTSYIDTEIKLDTTYFYRVFMTPIHQSNIVQVKCSI
jgi:hypothetical protein